MSVPTAEPTRTLDAPDGRPDAEPAGPLGGGWIYLWIVAAALALAAVSLLFPSTPSYDPWAWIVWGREIIHGSLHTPGGPTWKPLPVIFTTIFALFGSAAPNLWLVVARAGAAVAAIMTFKLAARMVWWLGSEGVAAVREHGADGADRDGLVAREALVARVVAWAPALLAGLVAVVGLVLSGNLLTDSTLGYSEGLATAAILIALERHLDGHPRQAFALAFVAALDRPEIWLFWGPYGLWLMWRDPGSRGLVIGLAVLTLALWFVPQKIGGGSAFSGVTRAHHPRSNSAAFAKCPFCTELADHAWTLVLLRIKIAAILVIAVAAAVLGRAMRARRSWQLVGLRERALAVILISGLFGYAWWILIALETQAGFSGNDRYLVIGSGFIEICGASGFGWVALSLPGLARRVWRGAGAELGGIRGAGALLASTCVLGLVFLLVPNWLGGNLIDIPATHRSLLYQATLRKDLTSLIARAGGYRKLESCGAGHVMVEGFQVPMAAWYFHARTLDIQDQPPQVDAPAPWPNVIFQDRDTGNPAQPLLPLVATIKDWERDGAHAFHHFTVTKEMIFFEDCAPQANDKPQAYSL